MIHKHKFTGWQGLDVDKVILFRMCQCGKIQFKGDIKKFRELRRVMDYD